MSDEILNYQWIVWGNACILADLHFTSSVTENKVRENFAQRFKMSFKEKKKKTIRMLVLKMEHSQLWQQSQL